MNEESLYIYSIRLGLNITMYSFSLYGTYCQNDRKVKEDLHFNNFYKQIFSTKGYMVKVLIKYISIKWNMVKVLINTVNKNRL